MKTVIYVAMLSIGLAACSNGKKEQTNTRDVAVKETVVTQPSEIIQAYLSLKDAFVKSDAANTRIAAEKLGNALKAEKMSESLVTAANEITTTGDLETQRKSFKTVTDGLIQALKANGLKDGVYVQYCPMAFNNTGANWLSLSEDIRNPYFGDKMLKCGKVTEEL